MFKYVITWIDASGSDKYLHTDSKEMALEVMSELMKNIMISRVDLEISKK